MNYQITFAHAVKLLDAINEPYAVIPLQNDICIILMQHGGRVLGPFLAEQAESIYWLSAAWESADTFSAFLESGEWNVGGERVWIAPEVQYVVQDRAQFMESMVLPTAMDPGDYALSHPAENQWRVRQQAVLQAFNLASGSKALDVDVTVRPMPDPLRAVAAYDTLLDGVRYAGYEQAITLTEHQTDAIMSESWNLIQLNPGGQLFIPCAPEAQITDYERGDVPAEARTVRDGHVRISITGQSVFKVGFKAAHVMGRSAYLNMLTDGTPYLLVRAFTNNPSSVYIEEPESQIGNNGHSVHIYNDSGDIGGFGELECNGQTIGGNTGLSSATDHFQLWLYVGAVEKLHAIASHLLGVDIA